MAITINPFSRKIQYRPAYNLDPGSGDLGHIQGHDFSRQPAPIVSVAVGSTGIQRTALWYNKMRALGCENRIQSLFVYDCNSTNIREWHASAEAAGVVDLSITPEYLPLSEGFLRQPNFFRGHYGAIERDVERMVSQIELNANRAGVRPQVIIEWIGFGGHARLSYLVHEHIANRFPNTTFLPVYCLPADRVLEQNIRDYDLWAEAQSVIGDHPSVITDNLVGASVQALDERVAIALAAVEAGYRFRPDAGTLAEIASSFKIGQNRWLGIDTVELPYQVIQPRRQNNARGQREQRIVRSAVVQAIKQAIWTIADPHNQENHTGFLQPSRHDSEQRIYCVLPFTPETVELVKEDIEDQLRREAFSMPYPATRVSFAAGNALWRSNQDQFAYAHVCRIVGLPEAPLPGSVSRVLNAGEGHHVINRRVKSRGEELLQEINQEHPPGGTNGARPDHADGRPRYQAPPPADVPPPLWRAEQVDVPQDNRPIPG